MFFTGAAGEDVTSIFTSAIFFEYSAVSVSVPETETFAPNFLSLLDSFFADSVAATGVFGVEGSSKKIQ